MEITKNKDNKVLTLSLSGRLDTTAAPELERVIEAAESEPIEELHLDLKELAYTSSAGLRVILNAQKFMNSRHGLKVYNLNDDIREVFDITGVLDILTIA